MRLARLTALLALLAGAGPARGQGFWDPRPHHGGQVTLGAGLLLASVSGGPAAVAGAHGAGLQLLLDYRLAELLAFDLRLGGFSPSLGAPEEINYPPDDGDYSLLSIGLHYDVVTGSRGAIWVGAEVALHYAQMVHYAYAVSGIGLGPALGVDLLVSGPFALRLGAHLNWVSLESGYGGGFGRSLLSTGTVDLLYVFR